MVRVSPILQSLALMCSNQPGLPMRFGANHLLPPPPCNPKAPGSEVQQQHEADESALGRDLEQQSDKAVMADLDSHAQHALMQVDRLSLSRVSLTRALRVTTVVAEAIRVCQCKETLSSRVEAAAHCQSNKQARYGILGYTSCMQKLNNASPTTVLFHPRYVCN